MKHILIFNRGYAPAKSYGGPVVTVQNIVATLRSKFRITVITPGYEIDKKTKIPGVTLNVLTKLSETENVIYLDEKHYNFDNLTTLIKDLPPVDYIYVNSFFYFQQLRLAFQLKKKLNTPLLIAPRGEFESNTFEIKKIKKIPYVKLFNFFIRDKKKIFFQATTNQEYKNILLRLNVSDEDILLLKNIPTIPKVQNLDYEIKKINSLKVVFLSRIVKNKNLLFVLLCLKNLNYSYDIILDIYGPIEDKNYWESCKKIIEELNKNIIVNYKGIVEHEEIFSVLSRYELFFLPTYSENFGHVISEALWSGTPVLISDQTPWSDISMTGAGQAYPLQEMDKFINYIESLAEKNALEMDEIRREVLSYIKEKNNLVNLAADYSKVFNSQ